MQAKLEHVNFTVPDPKATALFLETLLGWKTRWEGAAKDDGYTVHVGGDETYLALYAPKGDLAGRAQRYALEGAMNHIGIVVQDLDAVEEKVAALGYVPHNHGDYEPGRRFYFDGPDGIEYEMVSYA
ncbi:VOC family protein [Tropicibacter sp. R15_0]|uniref:VOC family protein n=1 Tax=Tropicibacter sp. R15_0 TaxID=2821101 RepID=UPI001ADD4BE4|nr:VOC family protein [Tropicibacter sp. R15_0]MBO9466047.1 VOC family protein [Tropicibacter sp. R15_0]